MYLVKVFLSLLKFSKLIERTTSVISKFRDMISADYPLQRYNVRFTCVAG